MRQRRAALTWALIAVPSVLATLGAARPTFTQDNVDFGVTSSVFDGRYLLEALDHDRQRPDYVRAIGAPRIEPIPPMTITTKTWIRMSSPIPGWAV